VADHEPSEREKELANTSRQREEEAMRGTTLPYPPPDEGTPPTPARVPEPFPPDELPASEPDED
jgi:hypothetical protein